MRNSNVIKILVISVLCLALGTIILYSINEIRLYKANTAQKEQIGNLDNLNENSNNNINNNSIQNDDNNIPVLQNNVIPVNNTISYHYVNTNYKIKYISPKIMFSNNGDVNKKLINKTKLELTGDYILNSVKYIIDTQNMQVPELYSNKWSMYIKNSDITLQGLQGEKYIWVQVLGKDGKTYVNCSNYFEMAVSYINPQILFSKNGDTIENIINSTRLQVSGDYIENSTKYKIDTQNLQALNLNSDEWTTYKENTDITLQGLDGKQYIWAQILGKDGNIYTSCSNYFEMLKSFTNPEISFTKNGDTLENIINATKIQISGDYADGSIKYIIDNQNLQSPDLNSNGWNVYTDNNDITLQGLEGKQYIWVQVQGRDGNTYTSCSNYFEMLKTFVNPEISFTRNGDTVENIINSTKIQISGNYVDGSIKYIIDTQNLLSPDLNSDGWNIYTDNSDITLQGLEGKQYIWIQVQGRDGNIYTNCSNYFEMLKNWPAIDPSIVAFKKPDAEAQFAFDPSINDFIYTGYNIQFDIEINTPNLKKIEYAFSMDGTKPDTYTEITEYNKDLSTIQTVHYSHQFLMNEIGADKTGRIWFRVVDEHDQVIDMPIQTYVFSTIQSN